MTDHRLADWDQPYTFAPDATAASIVPGPAAVTPGTWGVGQERRGHEAFATSIRAPRPASG